VRDSRPHIAFICALPNYDLFNRRSAIDSILCSILVSLKNDFCFTVNGVPFDELYKKYLSKSSADGLTHLSKQNRVAKFLPFSVKERLRIRRQKRLNRAIIASVSQGKPDLVFELLTRGSNVGVSLANSFGIPYIVYYDSPLSYQFKELFHRESPRFYVVNEIKSVAAANGIIVYSDPVKHFLQDFKVIGKDTTFYRFQTLDYSRLTEVKKQQNPIPVIGFIGTFMPWHRVDMLVQAFINLRSRGIGAKLLLVGAGGDFESILQIIKDSEFSSDIEVTGFVDGKLLESCKSRIDIGVMPGSNWYGIPTKVFEYGAAKIASIAPSTPTIADIFKHDKDLILFENNNLVSLERALQQLVVNVQLREDLANNLYKKITIENIEEKARQFYISLFNEYL
jgi:glycosyltransferase involved in cell wall biosynthesis